MAKEVDIVVLNDGETYTDVPGSYVVLKNRLTENGYMDLVVPIECLVYTYEQQTNRITIPLTETA